MWRSIHDSRKALARKYQYDGPTRKCANHYEAYPNIETVLFLYPMNTKQSCFLFSALRNALVFYFPMSKPALRCAELCMMDMSPTGAGSCQHQSPKENNSLPIFRQRQNNSTFSAGLRMEGPVRVLSVTEGTNPQEQERQSVLHLSYLKDTGRAASVTILIAGLALVET
jgi:hypothetical protein